MTKGTILTYHSETSILNGVQYEVIKAGKKRITLSPLYSPKLIGLPTLREPFQIGVQDLQVAIKAGLYTIKA